MEEKDTWYGKKGFIRNPFSSEPLTKEESLTKAFVDRTRARKDIQDFVQEKSGATIIISEIGSGKSSMINFAEITSEKSGKVVLRIDPRTNQEKKSFFKSLVKEVIKKILNHEEQHEKILEGFIKNGSEYELPTLMDTMKEIFDKSPSILIMDDLDKFLDFKKHIDFIKEVIDILPKNLQIITTGDINQIRDNSKIVSILYSLFDFPITLEQTKTKRQLREFVYGRMGAYSKHGSGLKFNNDIFDMLIDRTRGNLREVFRYLSELLKLGRYSEKDLFNTILKVDVIRLGSLDEIDKEILSFTAGENKNISEIREYLSSKETTITLPTIRGRMDELHQNCLTYKLKSRDSKKIIYSSPLLFKSIITILKSEKDIII